jgi:methionyl aminopeptidase
MIPIKTEEEIGKMREGGKRLALVMEETIKAALPGVKLSTLDKNAEELIKKKGGEPSFKTVKNYHWTTCINLNEGVVHGVPDDKEIKDGDIVSIDMGMIYKGFHTDMARTLCVRTQISNLKTQNWEKKAEFLEAGEKALRMAVQQAKAGNRVGHISKAIEEIVRAGGFSPVETLTGHGVGRNLHEFPHIPCFLAGNISETPLLRPGMVLAIEVIYNFGSPRVIISKDGWTVETEDGKLAALFEDTVVIGEKGPEVLTPCPVRSQID